MYKIKLAAIRQEASGYFMIYVDNVRSKHTRSIRKELNLTVTRSSLFKSRNNINNLQQMSFESNVNEY